MTDMRIEFSRSRARSDDRLAFKLLVALTYPIFLVAAVMSRIPPFAALLGKPAARVSVFAQARQASEAAIAFAFMG
jgi:hypothetical protein